MDRFLEMLPSIIVGGILAIIVVLIIINRIKVHKSGGCGCGCSGCTGSCPYSSAANIEKKEAKFQGGE